MLIIQNIKVYGFCSLPIILQVVARLQIFAESILSI